MLERICGAVTEAHQYGIIHRDIKPSNILFARVAVAARERRANAAARAAVPKLADFGISSSRVRRASRADDDGGVLARSGVAVGARGAARRSARVALFSPRWAAPEQLSSSFEGPATEVYALGLIAAYMLSGRALFADPDVKAHFDDRIQGRRLRPPSPSPALGARLPRPADPPPRDGERSHAPNPRPPPAFFEEMRAALEPATPSDAPRRRARLRVDHAHRRLARRPANASTTPSRSPPGARPRSSKGGARPDRGGPRQARFHAPLPLLRPRRHPHARFAFPTRAPLRRRPAGEKGPVMRTSRGQPASSFPFVLARRRPGRRALPPRLTGYPRREAELVSGEREVLVAKIGLVVWPGRPM